MNETQVKQKIGRHNWRKFLQFMRGQTVSVSPDGQIDYYECDVEKFLAHLGYYSIKGD